MPCIWQEISQAILGCWFRSSSAPGRTPEEGARRHGGLTGGGGGGEGGAGGGGGGGRGGGRGGEEGEGGRCQKGPGWQVAERDEETLV